MLLSRSGKTRCENPRCCTKEISALPLHRRVGMEIVPGIVCSLTPICRSTLYLLYRQGVFMTAQSLNSTVFHRNFSSCLAEWRFLEASHFIWSVIIIRRWNNAIYVTCKTLRMPNKWWSNVNAKCDTGTRPLWDAALGFRSSKLKKRYLSKVS